MINVFKKMNTKKKVKKRGRSRIYYEGRLMIFFQIIMMQRWQ